MTLSEQISAAGGARSVARAGGVTRQAVALWKQRGYIPESRLVLLRAAWPEVFSASPSDYRRELPPRRTGAGVSYSQLLDTGTYRGIDDLARAKGISVSKYMRQMAEQEVASAKSPQQGEEMARLHKALSSQFARLGLSTEDRAAWLRQKVTAPGVKLDDPANIALMVSDLAEIEVIATAGA